MSIKFKFRNFYGLTYRKYSWPSLNMTITASVANSISLSRDSPRVARRPLQVLGCRETVALQAIDCGGQLVS
jgi:hypothetical protein